MATHRPLVIVEGQVQELPVGDLVSGAEGVTVLGATLYAEPVVVAGFNGDVVHETGITPLPMFVTTTDGDIVTVGIL